jgi:hypothetical protein
VEIIIFLVLGVFAFVFIKRTIQLRTNAYHSNYRVSERAMAENILADKIDTPSWMGNKDKEDIFLDGVIKLMVRNGVSPHIIKAMASVKSNDFSILMYSISAQMEKNGASFTEQQMAAAEAGEKLAKKMVHMYEESLKT